MKTACLACIVLATFLAARPSHAGTLQRGPLEQELVRLIKDFDGRVGVCIRTGNAAVSLNGDRRFSLQSVMKLMVAMTVMDAVDANAMSLDDPVVVGKQDLSVYSRPLAELVKDGDYHTTVGELLRRAVADSDNTAVDVLVGRLGGMRVVQGFLDRKKIAGVHVDRDVRHLGAETVGLTWRPEYADADVFDRAIKAVPDAQRAAASDRFLVDPRDTATPDGMALLLQRLAAGELLSAEWTKHLLDVMETTATGTDRLKAGLPADWKLAHKTGTSGTWKGLTAATNDVGILTAPDGTRLTVVVFVADSRAPAADRAAVMANVARAIVANYRP